MQVRGSVHVIASPEDVFALVADPLRAKEWRSYLVASSGHSDAVGDRLLQSYEYQGRKAQVELTVTVYEPPERLELTITEPARARFAFHCRPEDHGTRVSMTASATLTGAAALLGGRIEKETDRLIRADLAALKKVLESER